MPADTLPNEAAPEGLASRRNSNHRADNGGDIMAFERPGVARSSASGLTKGNKRGRGIGRQALTVGLWPLKAATRVGLWPLKVASRLLTLPFALLGVILRRGPSSRSGRAGAQQRDNTRDARLGSLPLGGAPLQATLSAVAPQDIALQTTQQLSSDDPHASQGRPGSPVCRPQAGTGRSEGGASVSLDHPPFLGDSEADELCKPKLETLAPALDGGRAAWAEMLQQQHGRSGSSAALSQLIPAVGSCGLYQLVTIEKEEQNTHVVSKPSNTMPEWRRLLSDILPPSAQLELPTRLDFPKLDALADMECTGVCGEQASILAYLQEHGGMTSATAAQLAAADAGLLLWLPAGRGASHAQTAATVAAAAATPAAADAAGGAKALHRGWLIVWPHSDTFQQPSRQAPFCSSLRYTCEVCSNMVCLMDAISSMDSTTTEAEGNEPEVWVMVDCVAQRTDAAMGDFAFRKQLGSFPLQDLQPGLAAVIHLDRRTGSGGSLLAASTEPASDTIVTRDYTLWAAGELPKWFSERRVTFDPGFWDPLAIVAASGGPEPPCAVLLQLVWPQLYSEVRADRQVCLERMEKLRQDSGASRTQMAGSDQQAVEDLQATLRDLQASWKGDSTSGHGGGSAPWSALPPAQQQLQLQLQQQQQALPSLRSKLKVLREGSTCQYCSNSFSADGLHAPVALPCNAGKSVACLLCLDGCPRDTQARIKCPKCRQYHAQASFYRCPRSHTAADDAAQMARLVLEQEAMVEKGQRELSQWQAASAATQQEAAQQQRDDHSRILCELQSRPSYAYAQRCGFTRSAIDGDVPATMQRLAEAIVLHQRHRHLLHIIDQQVSEAEFARHYNQANASLEQYLGAPRQSWSVWSGLMGHRQLHDVVRGQVQQRLRSAKPAGRQIALDAALEKCAHLVVQRLRAEQLRDFATRQAQRNATLMSSAGAVVAAFQAKAADVAALAQQLAATAADPSAASAQVSRVAFKQRWEDLGHPVVCTLSVRVSEAAPGCTRHWLLQLLPSATQQDAEPEVLANRQVHLGSRQQMLLAHVIRAAAQQGSMVCVIATERTGTASSGCGAGCTEVFVMGRGAGGRPQIASRRLMLQRQVDFAAFDERSGMLVLLSQGEDLAQVYGFTEMYEQLIFSSEVQYASLMLPTDSLLSLQIVPGPKPKTSQRPGVNLLLVTHKGHVRLYDVAKRVPALALQLTIVEPAQRHLMVTCNGALLVVVHYVDGAEYKGWAYDAYSLEASPDLPVLSLVRKAVPLPAELQQLPAKGMSFRVCSVGANEYLMAYNSASQLLVAVHLVVTSYASHRVLRRLGGDKAVVVGEPSPSNKDSAGRALLDYFTYTFEKFPVGNSLDVEPALSKVWLMLADGEPDQCHLVLQYARKLWQAVQDETNKKFGSLKQMPFEVLGKWTSPDAKPGMRGGQSLMGIGAWLLRTMTLVPLQICRCEGNAMQAMCDGQPLELDDNVTDINAVADRIGLGMYDLVLQSFCNMPVFVVSSMGSQSVGKSYQLNHLGGCFFNVSGGRCTDGCWMTCRVWCRPECAPVLLIFLDMEGIGSWVRTEAEDMLLSLLCAALCNLTLFKTHPAYDRYTDQTLNRFNQGAPKVLTMCGGSSQTKAFLGKIVFCLKDISGAAANEAKAEFRTRAQDVAQAKDNFIDTLYTGGFSVFSFPSHHLSNFYTRLDGVVKDLFPPASPTEGQLTCGQFYSMAKTLLAKISHKDWTPIDRDQIRSKVSVLRDNQGSASAMGSMLSAPGSATQCLVNLDTQVAEADPEALEFVFEECGTVVVPGVAVLRMPLGTAVQVRLKDQGIPLLVQDAGAAEASTGVGAVAVVRQLRMMFEELCPASPGTQEEFAAHQGNAGRFIAAVVRRRRMRVNRWLVNNMRNFLEDHEASQLLRQQDHKMDLMDQQLTLCAHDCESCFFTCCLPNRHSGAHSCLTSHKCNAGCHHCAQEGTVTVFSNSGPAAAVAVISCNEKAGHPGRHNCGLTTHTCRMDCSCVGARNCRLLCSLEPGHLGDHMCDSRNHMCGAKCDLGCCTALCQMPYGQAHAEHVCGTPYCPETCVLCGMRCGSTNHFHDDEEGALHLCGRDHACLDALRKPKLCCSNGECEIRSELHRETRTFVGARGQFDYEMLTRQVVRRHECIIPIPPDRLEHDGPCTHSLDPTVVHFCGHKCPACAYRCNLAWGHTGRHETQHGNMIHCYFVSDQHDIDVADRHYVRGEDGHAEACDDVCRDRGHLHVLPCAADRCGLAGPTLANDRRHARIKYSDGTAEDTPKDELTHDGYWRALNFKDPSSEALQAEFRMCGATCGSTVHDDDPGAGAEQNAADGLALPRRAPRCVLPLWHAPVTINNLSDVCTGGHISHGGHYFPCDHGGLFSTYFIIDRSGSMSARSVQPADPEITQRPAFQQGNFNNVLGTVYEAVVAYVGLRRARSPADTVTLTVFNDNAETVFSNKPVSTPTGELVDLMLAHSPDGRTTFSAGLLSAHAELVLSRQQAGAAFSAHHKAVFVVLTDSGDLEQAKTRVDLEGIMLEEGDGLTVHVLGFGEHVREEYIRELAIIGRGTHHVCCTAADVGRLELVQAFRSLAEKPDQHATLVPRQE